MEDEKKKEEENIFRFLLRSLSPEELVYMALNERAIESKNTGEDVLIDGVEITGYFVPNEDLFVSGIKYKKEDIIMLITNIPLPIDPSRHVVIYIKNDFLPEGLLESIEENKKIRSNKVSRKFANRIIFYGEDCKVVSLEELSFLAGEKNYYKLIPMDKAQIKIDNLENQKRD